ncbi:MAG TPA: hypothetical protein VE173_06315 [Longimicrobiales bacterium]|nr:hypothetical protein [Longimicrobiales bacterium]
MLAAYIFCLVLGGGILLVSVLGDVLGDVGGDVDMGGDVDFQLDAGHFDAPELDAGHLDIDAGHLEVDAGHVDVDAGHADVAAHAGQATKILSIRTLIYALFGFGAVGTMLSFLGPGGFLSTFAFAVVGGLLSGAVVTSTFNWLKRTDTGAQISDTAYVGLSGTVTLPMALGSPGAVTVERGQRRISLRALPHESSAGSDPSTWRSVVVVDMERGVARVAPIEEDLSLEP